MTNARCFVDTGAVMTKKCGKCKVEKPVSAFTSNKSRKDGLNSTCSDCHKQYTQKHYAKNKAAYLLKAQNRNKVVQAGLKAFIDDAKSHPCADCGNRYPPYVMDFDHVRGKKLMAVSRLRVVSGTLGKLQAEIAKCEVVCSNCHRIRTHQRRTKPA